MMKIATHNSVTGESGHGFISWLITPFVKCQSKTIQEQIEYGVRLFDLRVRKNKKRGWVGAHGPWETKRNIEDILCQINHIGNCYVNMTCEDYETEEYKESVEAWIKKYSKISFCCINIKKPKWKCLYDVNKVVSVDEFIHLDWSSWHTLLPIPWIWKKVYYNNPTFNCSYFSFVDFI